MIPNGLSRLSTETTCASGRTTGHENGLQKTGSEEAGSARRKKISELELALEGKLEEHHRFLLKLQLDRLERVESDLAALEQRIQEKLQPYAAQLALLQEIPGVERTLAAVIIAG